MTTRKGIKGGSRGGGRGGGAFSGGGRKGARMDKAARQDRKDREDGKDRQDKSKRAASGKPSQSASRAHDAKPPRAQRGKPSRASAENAHPLNDRGVARSSSRTSAGRSDQRPAAKHDKPGSARAPSSPIAPKLPGVVQTLTVTADENDMRVDRFLEARFEGLSFSHIQRIVRKGELRVDGKRVDSKDRLKAGAQVRIPPLSLDAPKSANGANAAYAKIRAELAAMVLYEDDDVLVLNKPAGLAVQGGSGTSKHVDGMLEALRDSKGQKPRLVHRLDKETSGCLLIAKTRFAASAMAKSFRSREARKIYWALVAGVPRPRQGRISTYLAKEEREDDSFMRVARHGEEGASHAVTYYAVVETSAQKLAWVSLKPVTGRTHQLRAHMAHIEHAIIGDPKYFRIENWELPGGLQNRLHLLARRISIPHPRGGRIDVTAPLPPHMLQSWNLLGLDAARFDPIENAPEE